MDLLKLLHGFVKLVTCFSRPLPTKAKQKLDQRLKKLNKVYDLGLLRLWKCLYFFVISNRNETNTTLHQHLSTLQRTEAIFMENMQSANPTKIRQKDLPHVVKNEVQSAIFKSHESNGCQEEKRRFKVWFPPTHPYSQ